MGDRRRLDPFVVILDAEVGANGADDGVAVDGGLFCALNDTLEDGADPTGALRVKPGGVGVAGNRSSVGNFVTNGDFCGAAPVEEFIFDEVSVRVAADAATALVSL